MRKISLCGDWKLRGRNGAAETGYDIAARVPGCVHTDLMANGIIKDIFYRDRAETIQWIERENWTYSKNFTCGAMMPGAKLIFEGVDVYCDIYLNATWVGHCDDMFIQYAFPVDGILQEGENLIEVYFYSPVLQTMGRKPRGAAFTAERLYTRRIQCTYGWDWVGRFVTCGIYRPVYIEFEDTGFKAEDIYIYTVSADERKAHIAAELSFENSFIRRKGGIIHTRIATPDNRTVYENEFYCAEEMRKEEIYLQNPLLWCPNGMGPQPLYTYEVWIDGYDALSCKFGIRTAEAVQIADLPGSAYYEHCLRLQQTESGMEYDFNKSFSGFTVYINNQPVWVRGGNWVPCEPFPSAETKEKITYLLEMAAKAHVNMIRVWGGGIFEQEHFYEECDRLGLLVTQDFMMACGNYPEDETRFLEHLALEAEFAAKNLRNHPCIIWWSGDNENAINGSDLDARYSGRRSALQAIGPVLQRLDPHRLFLPSSPYGGDHYASKTCGTTHNTQFMGNSLAFIDTGKMEEYREYFKNYVARFIAEEPTMGAISLCSLRKFMSDEDIFGDNTAMWKYHTKTNPSLPKELFEYTAVFAQRLLGPSADPRERLFKLKYIQYEWIRLTLEIYRRNHGFCSGVVYWMLNECWPASSGWALIDYYGVPKASYYAFKNNSGTVLSSFDRPADGRLSLFTTNAALRKMSVDIILSRIGRNGKIITDFSCRVQIPENGAYQAAEIPAALIPEKGEILICDTQYEGEAHRTFYREGILPLKRCEDGVRIERLHDSVTIEASVYVHAVELDGNAIFEDNYFSLLPGQKRKIGIKPLQNDFKDFEIYTYIIEEYES